MAKKRILITAIIAVAIICAVAVIVMMAMYAPPLEGNGYRTATSPDGEVINYHLAGHGSVTLLFIHGWSCDSRYWKQQIPYFAQNCVFSAGEKK